VAKKKKPDYKWNLKQFNEIRPSIDKILTETDLDQSFNLGQSEEGKFFFNINIAVIIKTVLALSDEAAKIISVSTGTDEEEVLEMDLEEATNLLAEIAKANKGALDSFLSVFGVETDIS
jgi:hypothetical protein